MPDQDPLPASPPDSPGDTGAVVSAVNEKVEEPLMIEVHEPHQPVHSWREVFIHIGIVVVGLLIAIGLEQTMVFIHNRLQAHELAESLRQESLANSDVVRNHDLVNIDAYIENVQLNMANLDRAHIVAGRFDFVYTPFSGGFKLLPVSNTAWLAVRDGGALSLVSSQITDDYWHADYYGSECTGLLQDIFKDYYELDALLNLHAGIVVQSPEEKQQLLLTFARFNGKLRHLRSCYVAFDSTNEIALSGEKFSGDKMRELLQHEPPPPPELVPLR
jgi:hypothetical protein